MIPPFPSPPPTFQKKTANKPQYTTFNTTLSPPIPPSSPSLLSNCTSAHPDLCPFASVPFAVTNTGSVKSDYVALLFVSGEFGPKPYPIKTLVGYKRLRNIEPGKTVKGEIELSLGSIARADESGNLVLYPGKYTLVLDVDGRSEVVFELQGEERVLDWFPQPGGSVSAEGRGVTGEGELRMVSAVVRK
jgi:xylan 1,4-beta-xylosidase